MVAYVVTLRGYVTLLEHPLKETFYKRGLQSRITKTKTFFSLGGRYITDVLGTYKE